MYAKFLVRRGRKLAGVIVAAVVTPFLVRLWVSRIGRSSFDIASEMRVAADHAPALVAESTLVCWDNAAQAAWPISDELRADLDRFSGPWLSLRGR